MRKMYDLLVKVEIVIYCIMIPPALPTTLPSITHKYSSFASRLGPASQFLA
jgi:hypothetical protein